MVVRARPQRRLFAIEQAVLLKEKRTDVQGVTALVVGHRNRFGRKVTVHVGTEMGGRWWRRYGRGGFFARGNGRMWTDPQGLYFHRYLTAQPMLIPWTQVRSIESGVFHAGRWAWGLPITKVFWQSEGAELGSGFLISGPRLAQGEPLRTLRRELAARAPGAP